MEKKTIVFDIDGVICSYQVNTEFETAQPLVDNIDLIQKLHDAGHRIILFTGRTIKYKKITLKQLQEWGVYHDALFFNKPVADFYIDDRSASTDNLRNLLYMGEL